MWLTKENFDKISDTTVSFFVLQDALEADVEEWKKQPRQAAQVTAKVFLTASNFVCDFIKTGVATAGATEADTKITANSKIPAAAWS